MVQRCQRKLQKKLYGGQCWYVQTLINLLSNTEVQLLLANKDHGYHIIHKKTVDDLKQEKQKEVENLRADAELLMKENQLPLIKHSVYVTDKNGIPLIAYFKGISEVTSRRIKGKKQKDEKWISHAFKVS